MLYVQFDDYGNDRSKMNIISLNVTFESVDLAKILMFGD